MFILISSTYISKWSELKLWKKKILHVFGNVRPLRTWKYLSICRSVCLLACNNRTWKHFDTKSWTSPSANGPASHSSGCRLKWNICLADFCERVCFFFFFLFYCFIVFAQFILRAIRLVTVCARPKSIYCWFLFLVLLETCDREKTMLTARSTQPLIIGNLVWLINTEPHSFVIHHLWRLRQQLEPVWEGESLRLRTILWSYKNDLYQL